MEFINSFIDSYNIPFLSAFFIGILTSMSPCPLATNITAIAYISKDIRTPKHTLLNGVSYTLGRGISYTILAILMYFGLSAFQVSSIFQGWGDKALGPVLILIGLIMFDVIKLNFKTQNKQVEKIKLWLSTKGYTGALLLGMMFALAFCPYSGVLFFGVLTPLILSSSEGILLAPIFASGTGLPVVIFAFIIAFSIQKVSQAFAIVAKVEKVSRLVVASTFLLVGVYYLQFLVNYIWILLI